MSGLLVHEWIGKSGGSEKVFDRMVADFPKADILCLWNDDPNRYPGRNVEESWLSRTPLRLHKALALPTMIPTWRQLSDRDFDWALVSSHAFAHHFGRESDHLGMRKLVYVHTPARYIWAPELDPRGSNIVAKSFAPLMRRIDRQGASRTAAMAANSEYVRRRIESSWDRDARVIYPPVDIERIQAISDWRTKLTTRELQLIKDLPEDYVLGASRFVAYKRLDLVIKAGEMVDLPVVIAGSGPEARRLSEQAKTARIPVTIISRPSDALLYALYQGATVFVFPPVEDFGIMPVEAMACGTPVVVNHRGGARESVDAPTGGMLFDQQSPGDLKAALSHAMTVDRGPVAINARRFSSAAFDDAITAWVSEIVGLDADDRTEGPKFDNN